MRCRCDNIRIVILRTGLENVNMVAYGKTNNDLSLEWGNGQWSLEWGNGQCADCLLHYFIRIVYVFVSALPKTNIKFIPLSNSRFSKRVMLCSRQTCSNTISTYIEASSHAAIASRKLFVLINVITGMQ